MKPEPDTRKTKPRWTAIFKGCLMPALAAVLQEPAELN